jgi:hypothetical protein
MGVLMVVTLLAACGSATSPGSHIGPIATITPKPADTFDCPATPAVPTGVRPQGELVAAGATSVHLCGYSEGSARPPLSATTLDTGPANALADLINSASAAPVSTCNPTLAGLDVLLEFLYPNGSVDGVNAVTNGCQPAVFLADGQARTLDQTLQTSIEAAAIGTPPGSSGAGAPDLYGEAANAAIAHAPGYDVGFGGQEVDQNVPEGTVLLQNPPAGQSEIGNQISVIMAAHIHPDCTDRELAITFSGGGAGAGNDFGALYLRNVSADPCTLVGPIHVVGTDKGGTHVTSVLTVTVPAGLMLTPRSSADPSRGQPPLGEVAAQIQMAAEYRDDPSSPNGLCDVHWVIPAAWLVSLSSGSTSVPNASPNSAPDPFTNLVTCRGNVGAIGISAM